MTAGARHQEIIAPIDASNPRNSEASIVELGDGRLLLAWSNFYGGHSDFAAARIAGRLSADGGRTWGPKFTLQKNVAGMNVISAAFLRLRSGALALFYCHTESEDESLVYWRLSRDDGRSWSEERCATPDPGYLVLLNDQGIQLQSGRIVLPIQLQIRGETAFTPATYRSLCWFSDDEGATWQRGRGEIALPDRGAMEPTAVERRDGSLLMLMRTRLGHLYQAESSDGGDTWTAGRSTDLISSEAPANVKRIPSTGDLLLVWNNVYDPNRGRHLGRSPLTAAISRDDGATWEHVRHVETEPDHTYAYPSILVRQDEVLLTYYRSKEEQTGWELKLTILPLTWFYA
jgi:sialidase-1